MTPDDLINKYSYQQPKRWKLVDGNNSSYLYNAHIIQAPNSFDLFANVKREKVPNVLKTFDYITAKNGSSGRASLISAFGTNGLRLSNYTPPTESIFFKPSVAVFQVMSSNDIPLTISNISGEISGIQHWFEDNLVEYDSEKREFKNKKDLFANFNMTTMGTGEIKISLDYTREDNKFEARNESTIRLEFRQPRTYYSAIRAWKIVADFFNFIFPLQTNQSRFVNIFELHRKKYNGIRRIVSVNEDGKSDIPTRKGYDVLFKWSEVSAPTTLLENWCKKYGGIERGFNELKLIKNNPGLSEITRFISLISALEHLHRNHIATPDQTVIDAHLNRLEGIKSQLSNSSDKRLINRLKRAYEPSLEERLRNIRNIANHFNLPVMSDTQFDKLAKTRNNQVHSLLLSPPEVLDSAQLYTVNMHLARWLKLLALIMISVPREELLAIVESSVQFKSFFRDN